MTSVFYRLQRCLCLAASQAPAACNFHTLTGAMSCHGNRENAQFSLEILRPCYPVAAWGQIYDRWSSRQTSQVRRADIPSRVSSRYSNRDLAALWETPD